MNEPTNQINLEQLVRALGVRRVRVIDPFKLEELENAIKEELDQDEPSVVIVKRACALLDKTKEKPCYIVEGSCIGCKRCIKLGCPALRDAGENVEINATLCTGCNLCAQVCKVNAIGKEGDGVA